MCVCVLTSHVGSEGFLEGCVSAGGGEQGGSMIMSNEPQNLHSRDAWLLEIKGVLSVLDRDGRRWPKRRSYVQ